ncbi:hypothetical protein [Flavobacterium sp.]|uniref:hypothetical protein n=1 Tax=Flavobacterium sp. TaxID=239 RepID=UPI00286D1461|nr:hypothetical protein [Flavobacterium sp.]
MEIDIKTDEYYFSSQTQNEFYWHQNNTGNIKYENKYYCTDANHYITQPNWIICEICNCIVPNNIE